MWSKKTFSQKKVLLKNFLVSKYFLLNIFLVKFSGQQKFWLKNIWVEINFGSKTILDLKYFRSKEMLGSFFCLILCRKS